MEQVVGYTDERPWGRYTILDRGKSFQVKRLEIEPGKRFSLQSHEHRSETWFVLTGSVKVTISETETIYKTGEIARIKKQQKHRAECVSDEKAIIIEIQQGESFEEDDIVRYEDDYGRI